MSNAGRVLRAVRGRVGTGTKVAAPAPGNEKSPARNENELPPPDERGGTLSAAQIRWFETFGFLRLPGLFADEIGVISQAFDDVFAAHPNYETHEYIHFNQQRLIVHDIASKSPNLRDLPTDPRMTGVVESLLGPDIEVKESDGNLFSCDTSWHPDTYAAPLHLRHVKLSLYLDPLTADSGAIRLLVGTNHFQGSYARTVRGLVDDPEQIESLLGVRPDQLPSFVLESQPGDVVVWDYRTVHASFNGGARRRLLSFNYRGRVDDPD